MHVSKIIRDREAILEKIVFELRYKRGFTYLDRCGRIINALMDEQPEWTVDPNNPSPQGAALVSLANSCVLSVGTRKLDLSVEIPVGGEPMSDEAIETFARQVEHSTSVVIDQLGVSEFDRIGSRFWYIFPGETQEESEAWLDSLGCYSINERILNSFGGVRDAVGVSIVIAGSDRKYRVAFNGVQRSTTLDLGGKGVLNIQVKDLSSGQKDFLKEQEKVKARVRRTAEFPAMIDIDAFVENPESPNSGDFVRTSSTRAWEYFCRAVGD